MKRLTLLIVFIISTSCIKERLLYLPEIQGAKITEITDVSHAYLFYDESQEDKVDLNRKNLIGTTNWLINVDKRLTLEQAIPNITYLQDKKRNAKMHKNEKAKNFYTCNDTEIQNLGFIEFTNVIYKDISIQEFFKTKERDEILGITLNVLSINDIVLNATSRDINQSELYTNIDDATQAINVFQESEHSIKLYLLFDSQITFQDYITIKSNLESQLKKDLPVSNYEFIY